MNLDSLKVSGVNQISVTDSLNAPLLSFKVSLNDSTVIPSDNTLKITVRQNSNVKNYVFDLPSKLTTSDTFKVEPVFENNKVTMKATIERSNQKSTLTAQRIDLFSGTNEIQTNYSNANIEVVYPKNIDLVKYFFMNTFVDSLDENNSLTLDDLYFKDAFTKEDEKLNLEVNHLTVECLSNKDNNFSLDSLGNLTVRSIKSLVSSGLTALDVYPVGSIYMSVNSMNPNLLFGGSWEQIAKGRTLVGVDTTQTEFNTVKKTGGEKTHKLTVNEMPSHTHNIGSVAKWQADKFGIGSGSAATIGLFDNVHSLSSGNGNAHNNLQPYFTCYIWQRVS